MVKEKYRNSVSGYSDMENAIPAMYEKIERLGSHEKSVGPLALLLLSLLHSTKKKLHRRFQESATTYISCAHHALASECQRSLGAKDGRRRHAL